MQLGAIFPQTEIGRDPGALRSYAQAVEEMGFDHLAIYDHVLGADPANRPGWRGPYTHQTLFHEPFVLFGYFAAVTQRIQLVTSIIILPQRQTALVAKQAAEVDVLSGGRLRLGVGIGWNEVEYEALGEDFHTRGRRMEEQIAVMRALWTQEVVTFEGRWHKIIEAGLNPLPIQRPIPIWMGGGVEAVLKRIGKLADGWFPQVRPDDRGRAAVQVLHNAAREAGRDPSSIGIEARINASAGDAAAWRETSVAWRDLGATHMSINTMGAGFTSVDQHIARLREVKATIAV